MTVFETVRRGSIPRWGTDKVFDEEIFMSAAASAIAVIEWCFGGFSEPRKKPIVLNHKWLSTPICLLTHRLKSDTKRSSTSDS